MPGAGTNRGVDHVPDLLADLDELITEAGYRGTSGYLIGDDVAGWNLEASRPLALTQRGRRVWLMAVVGTEGGGMYPEDDLAEEAGVELAPGHMLAWDDNVERAELAADLGTDPTPECLVAALPEFIRSADRVESQLTAAESLLIAAAGSRGGMVEEYPLVPPT